MVACCLPSVLVVLHLVDQDGGALAGQRRDIRHAATVGAVTVGALRRKIARQMLADGRLRRLRLHRQRGQRGRRQARQRVSFFMGTPPPSVAGSWGTAGNH